MASRRRPITALAQKLSSKFDLAISISNFVYVSHV